MPVGTLKNTLYGIALPLVGKRCEWKNEKEEWQRALHRHHAVGACIQRFEKGKLTECCTAGFSRLDSEQRKVTPQTIFRTASIAKMVTALLVFRLQTVGKLNVQQDVSDLLGYSVRNPHFSDTPVTLGMLLSHTSSLMDSQAYFASFQQPVKLQKLLQDPSSWQMHKPGSFFRYSNLAAGVIGCALEQTFGMCLEELAQRELFVPLGVQASFDLCALKGKEVADSYRVLPAAMAFSAEERIKKAVLLELPDPDHHYLLASGNLYLTATDLAKLALAAWNGSNGFLNESSLSQMHTPLLGWPEPQVPMKHGMGLLKMEKEELWGHQGFAYGAVNGVFFDAQGNGFAALNSGVSEQRTGHLALINRDLIRWCWGRDRI